MFLTHIVSHGNHLSASSLGQILKEIRGNNDFENSCIFLMRRVILEKKVKPMKDINGTIGNFEYGQYISRSQCYVNVRCLEHDYVWL